MDFAEVEKMQLFTKSYDPEWGRIVNIFVARCDGVSEYINDKETYKILTLDQGTLSYEKGGIKKVVSAPAVFMLTDEEVILTEGKDVRTTTVFLKTTEIRDEFTPERIRSGEFEKDMGKTIYQDYLLIRPFDVEPGVADTILVPGISAYEKISKIITRMENELQGQMDGYWPCRSRSYLIELLSFISYVCGGPGRYMIKAKSDDAKALGELSVMYAGENHKIEDETVAEIIQYLSERIGEKVTQDEIMKKFSVNRNRLNDMFIKETSMTCLNYFEKMRINLAQIMLAETQLQIGEIGARVGYADANYFIKVFKKITGVTPSKYRDSFS